MTAKQFPVVVHKDEGSVYGVTVPDLPGCFSAGKTFAAALENSKEAILFHIEGIIGDGDAVPVPAPIEQHRNNERFAGGVWAMVTVDLHSP